MNSVKQKFLVFLVFWVVAVVLFGVVLNNFFISDDFDWLLITKKTENVFSYFLTNYLGERGGGTYSPFLNLLFYSEYNIWNLNPFGYHLTNLLFHLGASFFVFLIGLELFKRKISAFLAGFLFLIFPAHAEAVNWISGRPHVVGAFFYLVCLWGYLKFRQKGEMKFAVISVFAFIFSLLAKELALTLPFVILLLEFINLKIRKFSVVKIWRIVGIFFLLSAVYILVRYLATGILFGYYAESGFTFSILQTFKTFISGFAGLVSWGSTRIYLTELFFSYKILFLFLIFLVILFLWFKRKKWQILSWDFLVSLILFIIPFGLVLFLRFNLTSDEGERYLYLPSVGFCLLLGFFLSIFKKKILLTVFSLIIIFYFSFFLINKNLIWNEASQISKKIVNDFARVVDVKRQNSGLVFFSFPDTYRGAHVFRNGMGQAVALYYPDYHPDPVVFLPIYLRLDKFNKNDRIINWERKVFDWCKECDGALGTSLKGNYELTGFDRKETEDFIFELWGYDYSNFTSNTAFFYPKPKMVEQMKEKKIYFLMYNEGELKEFEWFLN